jgi:hypothetical protein
MTIRSGRRFNVFDAMVLVGVTAFGLALVRLAVENSPPSLRTPTIGIWLSYSALRIVSLYVVPILLSWTLGFFVLRAIRPRPGRRSLVRAPGTVACAAAVLAISIHLSRNLLEAPGIRSEGWWRLETFLTSLDPAVSLAVGTAWLVLIQSGRWRPIGDWVDRFGRLIGLSWIVATVIESSGWLLLGVLSDAAQQF